MALQQKINKVNSYPDGTMFFFQSYGYIGNSVQFWGLNSSGYVTDPNLAQKFTKEQTINQIKCNRTQDNFWPVDEIMNNLSVHADSQKLNHYKKI